MNIPQPSASAAAAVAAVVKDTAAGMLDTTGLDNANLDSAIAIAAAAAGAAGPNDGGAGGADAGAGAGGDLDIDMAGLGDVTMESMGGDNDIFGGLDLDSWTGMDLP